MTKKVNTIVAGLVVCVVSSAASASKSTNEEALKLYKGEANIIVTDEVKINENIKIHYIKPGDAEKTKVVGGGKKKRHNNNSIFGNWWDSLWANANSVKKKDQHFS